MVDLRVSNRVAILNLLYLRGGMSRKDMASYLQLTPAGISHITGAMLEEKVLIETKIVSGSNHMGRKEVILDINLSRFKVLCAYIPTREVHLSCVDLSGKSYFSKDISFAPDISGESILNSICDEMLAYIASLTPGERQSIIGIGLGVKGVYDYEQGISVNSFGLWECNLPVGRIVESRIPLRVMVDNNIRCVATAERMFNQDQDLNSMMFVKLGPLIGGALMVDNDIFRGFGYKAMELGHYVVDPLGFVCRCGKRGCLETIMGFDVIADNLALQYSQKRTPILYELTKGNKSQINMERIMASFDYGEKLTCDILDAAVERFAFMIVNVGGMVDPQKIILYGFPFESKKFLSLLIEKMDKLDSGEKRPIIEKSKTNLQLENLGCASIVLKDFLANGALYLPLQDKVCEEV